MAHSFFPAKFEAVVNILTSFPGRPQVESAYPFFITAQIDNVPPFGVTAISQNAGLLVDVNTKAIVADARACLISFLGPASS